jgi:hypothetical protein
VKPLFARQPADRIYNERGNPAGVRLSVSVHKNKRGTSIFIEIAGGKISDKKSLLQ